MNADAATAKISPGPQGQLFKGLSERDRTNKRASIKRPPARQGDVWRASLDGCRPLHKEMQPGAILQRLLSRFIENEDSLELRETLTLGQYLGMIHGAKLLLGDRVFSISRRERYGYDKYHLTTVSDDGDWLGVSTSVFDGKPYRGPVIDLYRSPPAASSEPKTTDIRTRSSIATNRRGTLGGLLFAALEAAEMNRWPREPDPEKITCRNRIRQYFSTLQIVPGVSAADYLYFSPIKSDTERYALIRRLQATSSQTSQAAALFLLEIRAVTTAGLVLMNGETLRLSGNIRYCGLGVKFQRAFALVSFAKTATLPGFSYRDAFVIPACNCDARIPVESSHEDQVFVALTKFVDDSNNRGLKVTLEKPLYCYVVDDKLVRPDATLSLAGTTRRCHVEVLGFDTSEYLSAKAGSEATLVRQGHTVIPVPAFGYKTAGAWRVGLLNLTSALRRDLHTTRAKGAQGLP